MEVEYDSGRLRCIECGAESSDDAEGWRAYLTRDEDEDTVETAVYCPECAEREFGED